jgi:hypothetical protein
MKKFSTEIKWGFIFTIAGLLWILLEKLMGWHGKNIEQHAFNTYFFIIPATHIYISAIKNKREKFYKGKMSWKQGFLTGLGITAVVSVLNPLLQYIKSTLISPEFFQNAIAFAIESRKMSLEQADSYYNLKNQIIQSTFTTLIFGVVASAVIAIIVKRNRS